MIFLDTETTGLGDDAEILDIAIVSRDGRVLLDSYVRPQGPIPLDAREIHGLDEAVLSDAPTWPEIYPLVGRILDTHGPVIVYNAEFDERVIGQVNRRHNLPQFQAEWHCAMNRFAEFAGIWHSEYGSFKWHKLNEALRIVNQPATAPEHTALSDAQSCRRIVIAMANETLHTFPIEVEHHPDREQRAFGQESETREYGGGRVTVMSVNQGCSRSIALILIGILALCLVMATCALIVSWLRWYM